MKRLTVLLITICMVLALAACGQGGQSGQDVQSIQTEAVTEAEETTTKEMPTEPEIETLGTTAAETVEASEDEGAQGTYVFGIVNAFGSTVPYIVCLKEDGDAAIVMDNSFTGARIYTGNWEGEEEITIKLYTWEGDNPFGDFFDAESETYDSVWTLDKATQTAKAVGYEGATNPASIDSISEEAKAKIDAFMGGEEQ